MKNPLLFCTLLAAFNLLHLAHGEIEFVYIFKERAFEQYGNMAPTAPWQWVFGAGVEGDNQVTGGTITYPGSGGPVNLLGGDGEYERDTLPNHFWTMTIPTVITP